MKGKSIIGFGNALMDVVVQLDDNKLLEKNSLPKGSMTLVDAELSKEINEQTDGLKKILTPGGSVANSIDGMANLGAECTFVGKVGKDELGQIYFDQLKETGAIPKLFPSETPTGVAMALVSDDGERTFATYLGAAINMGPNEITPDLFEGHAIAYIEGYLVQNHDLVERIAKTAKDNGLKVAIDLASFNVVEDNLEFLKQIVDKYIDIVFANEEEAKAFTGCDPEKALLSISEVTEIAVVKIGGNGSLIRSGEESIKVGTIGNPCKDSTGAGDLYASGFLYGLTNDYPLSVCGNIAAITSGNVITVYGARMNSEMWREINSEINDL